MPTIVVIDGVAHFKHPDKEHETFCGETYTRTSADYIGSGGARYADDFMAEVAENQDADICDECTHLSDEYSG